MMVENIGERVRTLRKKKGLTLKELAGLTGLSVASLSTVERDLCSPTLDNIQRICAALDTSLAILLDNKNWKSRVVHVSEREILFEQAGRICYEYMNFGPDRLDGLLITVEPHHHYNKAWTHTYDEMGYVLEGELIITIENQIYNLREGDAFYIDAMTEHNLSNLSDKPCKSIWVRQKAEK